MAAALHAMASQRLLMLLCLLCGACAAAKQRYHSVSMDKVLRSKAHLDCPPWNKSVTTSGNKLTIPAACILPPPKCCGAFEVLNHDMNRLSTLLQRSSVSSSASAAPGPSADPFPEISYPPVAPPAEAPAVTVPDSFGWPLDTLDFVVTVGFGTPAQNYTVSIDTGYDVSWIRCLMCSGSCYQQQDPIFDPTKSATYSALPCGHPQCAAAGGKCSNNGTCLYKID